MRVQQNEKILSDGEDIFYRDGDGGTSGTDGDGASDGQVASSRAIYEEAVKDTGDRNFAVAFLNMLYRRGEHLERFKNKYE